MSDTPRTDLNCLTVETLRTMKGGDAKIVLADVCRDLEMELTAANARVLQLEVALDAIRLKVLFQSSAYAREVFEIANNLLENKHEPNP